MNHQNLKIILLGAAMDKAGIKTRDIRFFSSKNDKIICIHSKWARDYAKYLEQQPWVQSYQAAVPLEPDYMQHKINKKCVKIKGFQTWLIVF